MPFLFLSFVSQDVLAPNVMAMVRAFNQLALLVPSEILEEKTPQARAKVISNYIQVSWEREREGGEGGRAREREREREREKRERARRRKIFDHSLLHFS